MVGLGDGLLFEGCWGMSKLYLELMNEEDKCLEHSKLICLFIVKSEGMAKGHTLETFPRQKGS